MSTSKTPRAKLYPISANDYLSISELKKLQLEKMQSIVNHAYANVPFYKEKWEQASFHPDHIASLEDIQNIPFIMKTDLRDNYPFGLFAVPMKDIVRLHASSGTTGKPTVVAYTKKDIQVWAQVMARTFASCGLGPDDIIQNAYGYGLFTGGLGAHYGSEELGATVIPVSGGNTDRQIMFLKDFGSTGLCCTPSYFTFIIERAKELGFDLHELPIRVGIFGAEPWTEEMRKHMEKKSGIKAYDIYGLSEIIGPGVASECEAQSGLHIFEDHFYPEIIDPETGKILPDGERGELVLTTLSKSANPMIRYRTRDITTLKKYACSCGRTIRQITRITSRSDDMLIIRGVNVFPSQIESALLRVPDITPHYQIVLFEKEGLDNIEVNVEATPEVFNNNLDGMQTLQAETVHSIYTTLGIRVKVNLVAPNTIARSEGKAQRLIDQRNK
ncbi:MAG: phenylacetate--CoA ligase [SAR324 cluster bacterium]|nr:phenylacetate--CoA ligase [SAR324 cluster bacterium]